MKKLKTTSAFLLSALIAASGALSAGSYRMVVPHDGVKSPLSNPAIFSVTPSRLPLSGGSISIAGEQFSPEASVTIDGSATTVSFADEATVLTEAPAHAAGVVGLAVANPDGQYAVLEGGIEYVAAPAVGSITPTSGSLSGGTSVSVSGSALTPDTEVRFGGVLADSVTYGDSTSLTAVAPSSATPGSVTITVSNEFGIGELANGFEYANAPTITSLSIMQAPTSGGQFVTVTGENFNSQTKLSFDGVDTVTTYVNSTTLSSMVPAHAAGYVDVAVHNPFGETVFAEQFLFGDAPALTSLSVGSGSSEGGDTVVITGERFTADTWVRFGGTNAAAVTFDSDTQLTVTTPDHAANLVGVTVYNDFGNAFQANAFEFIAPPAFTSVSSATGSTAGGDTVVIAGTGFTADTVVTFGGTDAAAVIVDSETQLTVTTPAHASGLVGLTLSNLYGQTWTADAFDFGEAPTIAAISQSSAAVAGDTTTFEINSPVTGGLVSTVTGTGFTPETAVLYGAVPAANVEVVSATELVITSPAHEPAPLDLVINNGYGTAIEYGAIHYIDTPEIHSISPVTGSTDGGETVSISGDWMYHNETIVTVDGIEVAPIIYDRTAYDIVMPAHAEGTVDIAITNRWGSFTLEDAYTYGLSPVVTAISKQSVKATGDEIVVTGTGFTQDTQVLFGSTPAAGVVINSGTQLTVTTPTSELGWRDLTVSTGYGSSFTKDAIYFRAPPLATSIDTSAGSVNGGDTVVITGSTFVATSTVYFGGVEAASVIVDPQQTQITAVTPAHVAGTVDVTVSHWAGESTLVNAFEFVEDPTITSFSRTNHHVDGGWSMTITGTGFSPESTVLYGTVPAASVTYVSDTELTSVSPAHEPAFLNVTVDNGFGAAVSADQIRFVDPPVMNSLSQTTGSIAGGDVVTLSGNWMYDSNMSITVGGVEATYDPYRIHTYYLTMPAHAAGTVDIVLTNKWGTHTLSNAYTYHDAPEIVEFTDGTGGGSTNGGRISTLRGNNFTHDTTVALGGVPATSVSFNGVDLLTFTSPAHTDGYVDVSVSNAYGSDTLAGGYLYRDPPTITSYSTTTSPTAGGETVTINGADFSECCTRVWFGGVEATNLTYVSWDEVVVTTPAHAAGTVDVKISTWADEATYANAFTFEDAQPLAATMANAIINYNSRINSLSVTGGVAPYSIEWKGLRYRVHNGSWTAWTAVSGGVVGLVASNVNDAANGGNCGPVHNTSNTNPYIRTYWEFFSCGVYNFSFKVQHEVQVKVTDAEGTVVTLPVRYITLNP